MLLFVLLNFQFYFQPIIVSSETNEILMGLDQLWYYEDTSSTLTLKDVTKQDFQEKFRLNPQSKPTDYNTSSTYWVRLAIDITDLEKNYLIEFYDQTIDELEVHLVYEQDSVFTTYVMGDLNYFPSKPFQHKNFEVPLPNAGYYLCYIKVHSHEYADIRVAIRSYNRFIEYALVEYFVYGLFYGMILIISLYNTLIFFAIKESRYLYYTFYILSVGVYAMSVDGVGYQYLWPYRPEWNQIAHGVALFLLIFWAILFARKFLNTNIRSPRLNKVLLIVLVLRVVWFFIALIWNHDLFQHRSIEIIPLAIIFVASVSVYLRGYKPARFFIVAFGLLFFGFITKALLMLSVIPFYITSYYSLHIAFVLEMLFLSFALSDRVRILKNNRDKAYKRILAQHEHNSKLKDRLNAKLEHQIAERTKELRDKNEELEKQKLEISEINTLLDLDNFRLSNDIKVIQKERLLNKELTYDEFLNIFEEDVQLLEILSDYKWGDGYECAKCKSDTYSEGTVKYSRRCTKCGYQESPTTHTLFHNIRFPLNKAFYIFYEAMNKDQYSLSELSEMLSLRKSTVWSFKKKVASKTPQENEKLYKIFNKVKEPQNP
ncbi:MAG: 7TM diverse intracellular signaling domain-containing protein [Cyclobacteriaceae bacterium]